MRLAEYEDENRLDSTYWIRQQFLFEVGVLEPAVLKHLADKPLQAACDFWTNRPTSRTAGPSVHENIGWEDLNSAACADRTDGRARL